MLIGPEFCNRLEFSADTLQTVLGGIGQRDSAGRPGAPTCAERCVVTERLDKSEGTNVSDRKLASAESETALAEGRIENHSPPRAENHVGAAVADRET